MFDRSWQVSVLAASWVAVAGCSPLSIDYASAFCTTRMASGEEVFGALIFVSDEVDQAELVATYGANRVTLRMTRAQDFDFTVPYLDADGQVVGTGTQLAYVAEIEASALGATCAESASTQWVFSAQRGGLLATSDPIAARDQR